MPCEPVPAECAVSAAPEWMQSVAREMQSYREVRRSARECERDASLPMVDGLHPLQPPMFDDRGNGSGQNGDGADADAAALPVARYRSSELSIRTLHERFLKLGLPVLIEGLLAENATWWHSRRDKLHDCCKRHADEGRGSDDDDIQMCADQCRRYAGLRARPPALRRLFDKLPRPLPHIEQIFSRSRFPVLWWSAPGAHFGNPTHFDEACGPTCSIQFLGVKRWRAWAPFDLKLAGIRAHTRFETVVAAGDVLILPPSWYHSTVVVPEGGPRSLTSIWELHGLGVYGSVDGSFRGFSPYGFDLCADGDGGTIEQGGDCPGWRATSKAWDAAMRRMEEGQRLGGGGGGGEGRNRRTTWEEEVEEEEEALLRVEL